ncbi:stress response protein nhaX [Elysia marginata]|uniref:Stress response protein nhaX n=1 Tax=Elysia marginata TaxID=1093978 RepID=A0AAV4EZ42_9GAST|nr:stress response protein nhaX [Elysia marginata]
MAETEPKHKRKILIAMDESQHSEDAFEFYMKNVHRPDDHVTLLYVPEYHAIVQSPMAMTDVAVVSEMMREEGERIKNVVSHLSKKLKDIGGSVKSIGGKPGDVIVSVAKEAEVSLIVMGSRGMGTIRRTFVGSVSDYVMHHSHIPVLVCKHPDVHK